MAMKQMKKISIFISRPCSIGDWFVILHYYGSGYSLYEERMVCMDEFGNQSFWRNQEKFIQAPVLLYNWFWTF